MGYGIAAFGVGPLQDGSGCAWRHLRRRRRGRRGDGRLSFVIVPPAAAAVTAVAAGDQPAMTEGGSRMSLQGKAAIVTGGDSGIGHAIAWSLVARGPR